MRWSKESPAPVLRHNSKPRRRHRPEDVVAVPAAKLAAPSIREVVIHQSIFLTQGACLASGAQALALAQHFAISARHGG